MKTSENKRRWFGFSLVEVLAAVSIIGVITFLAIPNIVRVKQDSEKNVAVARAQAANAALAAYIQALGRTNAKTKWAALSPGADPNPYYPLLAPFLAFAPENESDYMPKGYNLVYPEDLEVLRPFAIEDDAGANVPY